MCHSSYITHNPYMPHILDICHIHTLHICHIHTSYMRARESVICVTVGIVTTRVVTNPFAPSLPVHCLIYRAAKTQRMSYLYRLFSAKEP